MEAEWFEIVEVEKKNTHEIAVIEDAMVALTVKICLNEGGQIRKEITNEQLMQDIISEIREEMSLARNHIWKATFKLQKLAEDAGWM